MTLGQAAKVVGKSKSTLSRSIKKGTLSATRLDDNSYSIDPSELARVFDITTDGTVSTTHHATPVETLAVLNVKLEAAQAALERERELNTDLTKRLDKAEERVFLLSAPQANKGSFLRRLWGRNP